MARSASSRVIRPPGPVASRRRCPARPRAASCAPAGWSGCRPTCHPARPSSTRRAAAAATGRPGPACRSCPARVPRPAAPARRRSRPRLAGARLLVAALVVTGGRVALADHRDDLADLDGVVDLGPQLLHGARDGGGDLGVDLVRGDLDQGLVDLDGVADLDEPGRDHALLDGLTELGKFDVGHVGSLLAVRRGEGPHPCSARPARARWASPIASFRVGWAWTKCATSLGRASQL